MDIMTSERFRKIYERLKSQPRIETIPRIQMPSQSVFINEFARRGYPFVFRRAAASNISWELVRNICVKHAEFKVKARIGRYQDPDIYLRSREYLEMGLVEYFDLMIGKSGGSMYAGNQILPTGIVEALALEGPSFYPKEDFEPAAMWLGPKGSVTPLHKDSADNFAFHLLGRKRWVLFPIRDSPFLYMTRAMDRPGSDFAPSGVDLMAPDLVRFPEFAKAVPVELVLDPGDVLYLPAGWSHFVENLEPSLMINVWLSLNMQEPAVLRSA